MKTLNKALSGGDAVLFEGPIQGRSAVFQYTQTGIVASTVKIQINMRTDSGMPWVEVDNLTLDPNKPSDFIRILSGAYADYVQFKLITGGVTVGTINKVNFLS